MLQSCYGIAAHFNFLQIDVNRSELEPQASWEEIKINLAISSQKRAGRGPKQTLFVLNKACSDTTAILQGPLRRPTALWKLRDPLHRPNRPDFTE